jgi:hypothetical protein
MADDLSAAPSTGASEAAPAPADTGASSAPEAAKSESKPLSGREAAQRAISEVMARAPGETDRAAAVLKEGAGADEKLDATHASDVDKALNAEKAASDAAERAKKGWETRRANEAKAAEEQKQAETITEAVKAAIPPPAEKPAEEAKPATVETKHPDAPKWMTKHAAAEWQKLPEVVREEVVKRSEAFDKGYAEIKTKADRLDELKEYEQMSEQAYGQPLKETLKYYAKMDRELANPDTALAALENIVSNMPYKGTDGKIYKWDLPQLAEYILQQSEQGVSSFQDPQADIQRELADVKRQLAEFQQGIQSQREIEQKTQREQTTQSIQKQIETFAASAPRFDELVDDIDMILSSPKFQKTGDTVADLKKAYEMAERLKPAPSLSPPAPDLRATDTAAQTRRGSASISGAPSGSTPAGKRLVASSPREAARMALSKMGMGSGA